MNIRVGIITAERIKYKLHGDYSEKRLPDGIMFEPQNKDCFFELENVTIGIDFHWQRTETQLFCGALQIINVSNKQQAVNVLDVEDYLQSVISSEMASTSSLELLKTHAIISRSWAVNAIINSQTEAQSPLATTKSKYIKYYERDAHTLFHVCADDHCQRYQGITRIHSDSVRQAVNETKGLVLKYNGQIADARFYKCCGGATELFENVWADNHHPYLIAHLDDACNRQLPDLTIEQNARKWIMTSPQAFCNTHDSKVLKQVLNNYDQETADFYRWKVKYSQEEISALVVRKSGVDFGIINDLKPVLRGSSGRIIELKIIGSKRTLTIGKELEIRKWLSPTHLYSSAFVVDRDVQGNFILYGAGWGHGVGLCQIGAAMMANQGYNHRQILKHYFPNTIIQQL